MSKIIIFITVLLLPFLVLAQTTLVIKNITVIDMKDPIPKKHQTVVIEGNKMTSVSSKTKLPASAKIIDATNKFLIAK